MPYSLEYSDTAANSLNRLDRAVARRVRHRLDWLAENADSYQHEAMTGQYSGMYRIRVGNYRAVYELDRENRKITVDEIEHRSRSYRR